jgi:hypothetical protein
MDMLSTSLSVANLVLLLFATIGGFFGFRNARRAALVAIQKETIEALQQQIDALKTKQEELMKENAHLHYVISTIQAALSQMNVAVTISGDLVTIQDAQGNVSKSMGKRPDEA